MRLLERFSDPAAEYGPLPLWWWSGAKVTRVRLRAQMERMVSQGIRQAAVMCLAPAGPLFGSLADDPPFLSPEWLELLDGACADAAELGFRLWLYDQVGFSGANFQGRLIAENPAFAGQALIRTTGGVEIVERGFDYFEPKAGAALLDRIHGTLERHVGRWFGVAIGGFFQDELPPMPTWGPDFAATFAEVYGYDLEGRLECLWKGVDDRAAAVRRAYHEHRARLARRGFFDQHDEWYARHGLTCGFDQASPAREGDPVGGVHLYGDYLWTHSGYGAPGCDHWGDTKVHSSLAHADGKRTWIEAFHSSGWGGTLEETYDWLAPFLRRGATLYDPHAVYYSTAGGWWEWAAPSTCWRQPYWPSYHVFARAVERLCSVLSAGAHVCDTILLSPTSTAQAYLTLDGPLPAASAVSALFEELNGVGTWFAERRGVLERAGIDHDVLGEHSIASARVRGDTLVIGEESYRNVILPGAVVLSEPAAAVLGEFAAAGGRVISVGASPLPGAIEVARPEDVPPLIRSGPMSVRADAPFLLRRHGDAYVILLTAHDETTGTAAPILDMGEPNWWRHGLDWDGYWRQLREDGYEFRPPGDRRARVRVKGLAGARAQRWDPRTGHRTDVAVRDGELEVSFEDGPIALLVLGERLPPATRRPLGPVIDAVAIDGPWVAHAESTLDNRWGDLAAPSRDGILPIEVWRMEHRADGGSWAPVTATFGPFAKVRGTGERGAGENGWRPAEWSLSRGIRDDPLHLDTLGPKGYVPEEFLDWRPVAAGERVAVRTHLTVPGAGTYLAVAANAARTVRVDGAAVPVEGEGYLSFSPLPSGSSDPPPDRRAVAIEIEFTADETGPVRASFAIVSDPGSYRRPEFLTPGSPGRTTDLTCVFALTERPDDAVVQVASDGPCIVLVNGEEAGRQGDFDPYPGFRATRVHPYDIGGRLRLGENTLVLRVVSTDGVPTAAALDSVGLALMTGEGWTAMRDGAAVPVRMRRARGGVDPRFVCARPRPHPLPGAGWLSDSPPGVVAHVVPDLAPAGERTEWLRFAAPLGAVRLRVPTSLEFTAVVDGAEIAPADGVIELPRPMSAGEVVVLKVTAVDGRRGGALLDGPIEATVAPAVTRLLSWEELGLRNLGGLVRYRTGVGAAAPEGSRAVLDLGDVRGTADVMVNGVLTDRLVWGPWRSDVTDALIDGENEIEIVVRGTLAGYLDDASPTRAVAAGQARTGLFGPVRLSFFGDDS